MKDYFAPRIWINNSLFERFVLALFTYSHTHTQNIESLANIHTLSHLYGVNLKWCADWDVVAASWYVLHVPPAKLTAK